MHGRSKEPAASLCYTARLKAAVRARREEAHDYKCIKETGRNEL